MKNLLYKVESKKNINEIIEAIKEQAGDFDFIIREIFEMGEQFRRHDVEVDKNFIFYSIMLCNPQKAYDSIKEDLIRGAVLLPPKQVIVYRDKKTKKTNIAYLPIKENFVKELLPDDIKFQKSIVMSCEKIINLINKIII
ncbi:DUF302 domain-containing protein [bacterium]|nr:DUF302 domain-containing protein [bacterium]